MQNRNDYRKFAEKFDVMEINSPEIYELRLRIEASIKRKIQTPADFDFLRGIIWERTHEQISTSTLKRLWGYVDGVDTARNSTLNVLSKSLGYNNWDDFVNKLKLENQTNSDLVLSKSVVSCDLSIGDTLSIAWQPNRVCQLSYLGNDTFKIIKAENSKLKVGDTFRCGLFILGEPVYINELRQNNGTGEPKLFVIGNKSGLTKLKVETF
ncbi:MAG: hypothetical protein J6B65_03580 [Paludibacteraceae bacterium]|nr:hypothetical protein [Paludibacteraceae bacterium]